MRKDYGVNIPIYITENGVGFENESEKDGEINDEERIQYLQGSFQAIERANAEGMDVRGYYLWSLLDNFEWTAGYSMKFGLYTRDRKAKKSAKFYRRWIKTH